MQITGTFWLDWILLMFAAYAVGGLALAIFVWATARVSRLTRVVNVAHEHLPNRARNVVESLADQIEPLGYVFRGHLARRMLASTEVYSIWDHDELGRSLWSTVAYTHIDAEPPLHEDGTLAEPFATSPWKRLHLCCDYKDGLLLSVENRTDHWRASPSRLEVGRAGATLETLFHLMGELEARAEATSDEPRVRMLPDVGMYDLAFGLHALHEYECQAADGKLRRVGPLHYGVTFVHACRLSYLSVGWPWLRRWLDRLRTSRLLRYKTEPTPMPTVERGLPGPMSADPFYAESVRFLQDGAEEPRFPVVI